MARNQRAAAFKAWETRRRAAGKAGSGGSKSRAAMTARVSSATNIGKSELGLPAAVPAAPLWRKNPFGGEWLMVGSRKFRVAPNHLVGPDRVIKRRWQVEGREGFFDSPEAAKKAVEELAKAKR